MARRKRRAAKKRKVEWSKVVCLLAMLAGLLIVQECLFLMYLCIKSGYTAAAAWLTAATGVGEAIIIAGANGYLSLAKSDHKRGGITFEAAKANNFRTDTEDNGSTTEVRFKARSVACFWAKLSITACVTSAFARSLLVTL